jgi:hypothetical protein
MMSMIISDFVSAVNALEKEDSDLVDTITKKYGEPPFGLTFLACSFVSLMSDMEKEKLAVYILGDKHDKAWRAAYNIVKVSSFLLDDIDDEMTKEEC